MTTTQLEASRLTMDFVTVKTGEVLGVRTRSGTKYLFQPLHWGGWAYLRVPSDEPGMDRIGGLQGIMSSAPTVRWDGSLAFEGIVTTPVVNAKILQ